jgi:hypothetical protein
MGLIGYHDNVRPVGEFGEYLSRFCSKLLYKGEDIAVVFPEKLFQMFLMVLIYMEIM